MNASTIGRDAAVLISAGLQPPDAFERAARDLGAPECTSGLARSLFQAMELRRVREREVTQ